MRMSALTRFRTTYPAVILASMTVALIVLPHIFGGHVDSYSVYVIFQTFADFGLVALAIGMGMVMGEYDLSVAAVYGLRALIAVELGVHGVLLGVFVALVVGGTAGGVQGALMGRLGMRSVEVTLGGLLIITGITVVAAHEVTVTFPRLDVGLGLDARVLSVFSGRSLVVIGVFVLAALVMGFTRLGPEVRGVGGPRSSRSLASALGGSWRA